MTFNSHDTIDAIISGEDDIHKIRNSEFRRKYFLLSRSFSPQANVLILCAKKISLIFFCFLCALIWEVEWIFRIQKDIHIPRKNRPAIDCAPIIWFNNQNRFKNSSIELNVHKRQSPLLIELEMFFLRMSASLWELLEIIFCGTHNHTSCYEKSLPKVIWLMAFNAQKEKWSNRVMNMRRKDKPSKTIDKL